jgi:tryptophan 2,3-dioxygenase
MIYIFLDAHHVYAYHCEIFWREINGPVLLSKALRQRTLTFSVRTPALAVYKNPKDIWDVEELEEHIDDEVEDGRERPRFVQLIDYSFSESRVSKG